MQQKKILILGIGNNLLTDEGVGIHAINYLQQHLQYQDNVKLLDGGTLSFTLAAEIEDADLLIVIDASQINQPPGTIRTFVDEEMDHFLGTTKRSVHEVGLLDLLDISRLAGHLPKKRALIGIQPEIVNWGDNLSESVEAALGDVLEQTHDFLHQWA
jgi:hydrogenase maturation protease